jgi:hypothetical protein
MHAGAHWPTVGVKVMLSMGAWYQTASSHGVMCTGLLGASTADAMRPAGCHTTPGYWVGGPVPTPYLLLLVTSVTRHLVPK